jgi:predicted permease
MRSLREWVLRLWGTIRRHRADEDLKEELRLHVELAAGEARRRGQATPDAERAARVRAGGVSQALDALRDQRGLPWLDALAADLKRMPRLIARHRGYFAFATTTLAVAVGVNLIVFTVVNALWLRPLPFPDADRLVTFTGFAFVGLGSELLKPFEAVAGQVMTDDRESGFRPQIEFDDVSRELETLGVTPDYFKVLGLTIRGRDFTQDDDRAGAEPVAIISDQLWSRVFGRRDDVVGAVVPARPFPIRVIGVAPPDFAGARRGERADLWIPSTVVLRAAPMAAASEQDDAPLMGFARLRPGQTAEGVLRQIVEGGDEERARWFRGVTIVPLKDVFGSPDSRTIVIREGGMLGVVSGLALLVLLGGCATLMALVLVHYERRRRDLAVRLAIGASRRRLASELAREMALLVVAGTAGAILIAVWGLRSIPSLSLPGGVDLSRLDLSIDWRVVGAAITATTLTLIAAAFLPMRRFTRASLPGELLAGPSATTSVSSQRVRQTLLAVHVAATIVVLVAAGLFVRAVVHGFGAGPGFDADRTLFVGLRLKTPPITSEMIEAMRDPAMYDLWRQPVVERSRRLTVALRALPGVQDVAMGPPPMGSDVPDSFLEPRTVETADDQIELAVGTMSGTPELLPALGVPMLTGRGLVAADAVARPAPAVVTESLARRLWPLNDALGQALSIVRAGRGGNRFTVVGVARDFTYGSFSRPATGVVVTATDRGFGSEPQFVVRAASAEAAVEPIRKLVRDLEPDAYWLRILTGRDLVARDLGQQRLGAWFFSGFGLTALLLGVGGVFGLVAYLAESRQREFGVRVALGATPRDLVWRGLSAALAPVALGVTVGLLAAALVARVFTSLLAGLSALDPLTYAAVAVTMLSSAVLAGLGAAWRLRRMTPTDALRAN